MARYREIYKEQRKLGKRDEWKDSVESNLKQKGVTHVNDKLDVIKKGSTIKRVADKNEPIDNRVKYASILDNDANNYIDTAKDGGLTMTKDTCQKEYKLNKNIKVAPANLVREYVMKSYGNSQLKEYKDYVAKMFGEQAAKEMVQRYGNVPLSKVYDPIYGDDVFNAIQYNEYGITGLGKSRVDKIIQERVAVGQIIGRKVLRDHVYSNGNDVYDHFKKLGYDAIVDAEDINEELFDYPIIVLNPKESLTFVKDNPI